MDISEMLSTALRAAARQKVAADSRGELNRRRSCAWVECLADQFRAEFAHDPTVRVFSKGFSANREDFGLNELLYDISVCRVASVQSSVHGTTLFYVQDVLWQVESEFARNGREAIKDFNKLVCGSGRTKLFVGSQVTDNEAFIGVLRGAACACIGRVFAALLPHPDQWEARTSGVRVWELIGGRWVQAP